MTFFFQFYTKHTVIILFLVKKLNNLEVRIIQLIYCYRIFTSNLTMASWIRIRFWRSRFHSFFLNLQTESLLDQILTLKSWNRIGFRRITLTNMADSIVLNSSREIKSHPCVSPWWSGTLKCHMFFKRYSVGGLFKGCD